MGDRKCKTVMTVITAILRLRQATGQRRKVLAEINKALNKRERSRKMPMHHARLKA